MTLCRKFSCLHIIGVFSNYTQTVLTHKSCIPVGCQGPHPNEISGITIISILYSIFFCKNKTLYVSYDNVGVAFRGSLVCSLLIHI